MNHFGASVEHDCFLLSCWPTVFMLRRALHVWTVTLSLEARRLWQLAHFSSFHFTSSSDQSCKEPEQKNVEMPLNTVLCQLCFFSFCRFRPSILSHAAREGARRPDGSDPLLPLLLRRFLGSSVPAAAVFQLERPDFRGLY